MPSDHILPYHGCHFRMFCSLFGDMLSLFDKEISLLFNLGKFGEQAQDSCAFPASE
jgi:hypothetical protein